MLTRLKGAKVVDPGNIDAEKDILIKNGYIEAILDSGEPYPRVEKSTSGSDSSLVSVSSADSSFSLDVENNQYIEIDVSGKIVVPGLIDLHVHLREPGHEYKETIETGLMAAARGGFTAVCPMANTSPVNDNAQVTSFIINRAKELGLSRIYPVGAITKGLKGESLAEFGDMKKAGIAAVSDDGCPVENSMLMRRALEYAKGLNIPVISHSEDLSLSKNGAMNEGITATKLGIKGIPNAAEASFIMREICLAELAGAPIHIAHVSCEESVEAIRNAKKRGIKVTCETAPHYFTLTEKAVAEYDTNAKMNPPLRTEKDRQAIIKGLADGTIDCIATDHAPHSSLEKDLEFDMAAFGIIGLETSLPLSLKLVENGILSFETLIEKMSKNPASILGINNDLKPDNPADITVIDMESCFTIDPKSFLSKSRNTPFAGFKVTGEAYITMVKGKIIYQR